MPRTTFERDKDLKRTILIVDDESINREILGFIIGQDYEVLYAENGKEALDLIHNDSFSISLILLDLLMPEMDGYELLHILSQEDKYKYIPVIVLTSEKEAEIKSLELGAVDFIPKPYDTPEVIMARIERSIELAESMQIIQATERDFLTGLFTKDYFFRYCEEFDVYHPFVETDAIVLNINHFHLVNELYGRDLGDEILRRIARDLLELAEKYGGFACRSEADSFFLYLPHQDVQNEVIDAVTEGLAEIPNTSRIRLRAGIYSSVDRSLDVEMRFDRAQLACNTLRNNYSQFVAAYDDEMHQQELYNERLMTDTDDAIEQRQFMVYYQPKYNITGDKPVLSSAEALIRWSHPELGMVSPGDFVPLFEENGLVQKLDRYVWKEAAAQIARWRDKYGITIPVSVNVSRMDIYDSNLEAELLDYINKAGISPGDYLLEITESAYTDNSDQIIRVVDRLRSDGFKIEMDDFGSGYSSLNMLTSLPIDALKLDMKFVQNILSDNKEYRMVELMMEIAEFLAVPVIAEGVEDEKQYKLLKDAGCDIIQGYYFSKPLPPDEFEKLIVQRLEEEHNS